MTSLDRVDFASLTPTRFHSFYRGRSKPFIITGAFDGVKDWTLDVISEQLGTSEYNVRVYGKDDRSRPKREWKTYSEIEAHTPQAYVELLRNRTAHENSLSMAQVAFGQTPLATTIRDRVLQLEQKCARWTPTRPTSRCSPAHPTHSAPTWRLRLLFARHLSGHPYQLLSGVDPCNILQNIVLWMN